MSEGLATTFRVLTRTNNEAAVRALIPALDSPHQSIQEQALTAILARRSLAGHREVLRRLHTIPDRWKDIIERQHDQMTRALRDALVSPDRQMRLNACRATVWLREFDLIPMLLTVLDDATEDYAEMAAETLLALVDRLHFELADPPDQSRRRDPHRIRHQILGSLESSVERFARHKRREVVEAFLLLVQRDNATLKRILQDPHHAGFLAMVDVFSNSRHGGLTRLLLSFLDDPRAPTAVLSVIARRCELRFVRHLLRKIGHQPSAAVARNLKRIESVPWLSPERGLLEQLDDAGQHGAIRLLMTSRIPRLQAFATIEYLLLHGKPAGRREAANALDEFHGASANALAVKALDDPDPQVQANVITQLRRRGIPGVLPRLLQLADSPHAVVREAARESLPEFSFHRFLGAFELLEDGVRRTTARLVRKLDPQALPLLQGEMESRARTRRLRGLEVAQFFDAVEQLEGVITRLLHDDDHMVRLEAAMALQHSGTDTSRRALEGALGDRSAAVRQAALRSLNERARSAPSRQAVGRPRG